MTSSPSSPPAPTDPGEDWARAIAEMTRAAEVARGEVARGEVARGGEAAGTSVGLAGGGADLAAARIDDDADAAAVARRAADSSAETARAGDSSAGDGPAVGAALAAATQPGPAAGRRRRVALAAIGAATVVIGSLGIWAAVAAHDLRTSAADANLAFTDPAATRAVDQQVAAAVNTIFSYSYADSARTRAAAQGLLTGAAIRQYDQLFAIVEKQAPTEKLTVTTRVSNVGVELLTGDRARVLVFANQQDTVAGTGKTSYGGAMFAVTAVNLHGKWRIESIDTFTGPA
ncbi:MAG: hypothetical protein ACLQFR_13590 [Streptosporangiaceae bacterium]